MNMDKKLDKAMMKNAERISQNKPYETYNMLNQDGLLNGQFVSQIALMKQRRKEKEAKKSRLKAMQDFRSIMEVVPEEQFQNISTNLQNKDELLIEREHEKYIVELVNKFDVLLNYSKSTNNENKVFY